MADTKISNLTAVTLPLTTTDEFVVARAGTTRKADANALAAWELILDLPLTSSTNWGMGTGWSNDGAKMIGGTDTTKLRNKYDIRLPLDYYIAEVEIQLPNTSRSASDQRAGLLLNWNGSGTGTVLCVLRWNAKASGSYYDERDAVDAGVVEAISGGLAVDTWHKLRVIRSGMHTAAYVNGTFQRVSRIDPHASSMAQIHFLGLHVYQIDAWFRNLKVWRSMMPA